MLSVVVDALVRGSYQAWAIILALWLIAAVVVLAHRRDARSSGIRVIALLSLASATAAAGAAVASAVAIPRLRWITAPTDPLILPKGDTWRRLRGPSVPVTSTGDPDLAVPTIDEAGQWILVGLLSGKPIPSLSPAPKVPPAAGSPRLCATDSDTCRAWPPSWPDPTQSPISADLAWTKDDPLAALAYDVESGRYLTSLGPLAGPDRTFELLGRVSNDPPRDIVSSLFVLRRFVGASDAAPMIPGLSSWLVSGRLQAMRIVSTPSNGTYVFQVQRSDVSLTAGPLALRLAARPLLGAAALAFPIGVLAYLFSPALLLSWLRRKTAVRRKLERPLTLSPIPSDSASLDDAILCTATDDVDLGPVHLARGAVVNVALAGHDGEPITSSSWFEIPHPPSKEGPVVLFRSEPEPPPPGKHRIGLLVPADTLHFWGAAGAWLTHRLRPLALCAAGVAVAAPGLVALASLLGAR